MTEHMRRDDQKKKMEANSCKMMLVGTIVSFQVSAFKPPFFSIACQLPADEPSDQRPDLRRGHPGRGWCHLLPVVGPPAAEVPPPNSDIIRALEPHVQVIKHQLWRHFGENIPINTTTGACVHSTVHKWFHVCTVLI